MPPPTDQPTLRLRRTGAGTGAELLAAVLWRLRELARPRTNGRVFVLAADATLGLRPRRGGLVLTCRSGEFLVTQAGDPADHVIAAGEAFRTTARGKVVVWAFQPGVLSVA